MECLLKSCKNEAEVHRKCRIHFVELNVLKGLKQKRCTNCCEIKSYSEFHFNARQEVPSMCGNCSNKKARDKHKSNPDTERDRNLKRKYGISLEEYNSLLSKQKGVCLLCNKPERSRSKHGKMNSLAVHHCHRTGKILGLCCFSCNSLMGYFKDDPELLRKAADICEGKFCE